MTGAPPPEHLVDDPSASLCYSTYPMNVALFRQDELDDCRLKPATTDTDLSDLSPDLIATCLAPLRSGEGGLPRATMFIFGDSHAGVAVTSLKFAVRGAYQVRHVYFPSVSYVRLAETALYQTILAQLSMQMRQGDALVVVYDRSHMPIGKTKPGESKVVLGALEQLTHYAVSADAPLILLGNWPMQGEGAVSLGVQTDDEYYAFLEPLLTQYPSTIHYVSTYEPLCADGSCYKWLPGTSISLYFDDNHLNTVGSIYLWPYLCDALVAEGLLPP